MLRPEDRFDAEHSRLRRWIWPLVTSALVILAAVAGFTASEIRRTDRAASLPDLGQAPSYTFTNQLGQKVSSKTFAGKVQIVTFLFPYCTTICPLIAAHLTNFMNEDVLPNNLKDQVQVVAFNVDPAHSGPKEMKAFLAQYGWNPRDTHWEYLTGNPEEIRRVVTGGFHVSYQKVNADAKDNSQSGSPLMVQPEVENALAKQAHVNYDIVHNDAMEVVDRTGHIRKIYLDADTVGTGQLTALVQTLLKGQN